MAKRKQITLAQLRKLYKDFYKKDVSPRYKNDFTWLSQKVHAVTETTYVEINNTETTTNITNNFNFNMSPSTIDSDSAGSPPTAKKQKVFDAPFCSLLNKQITFPDFMKFPRLKNNASAEEQEAFVKKAKGEYGGKPPHYCLPKTQERLSEIEAGLKQGEAEINGMFVNTERQKQVEKAMDGILSLSKSSADENTSSSIHNHMMPMVIGKVAKHLLKYQQYLEEKIIYDTVNSYVTTYEKKETNSKICELKEKIKSATTQLNACPDGAYFDDAKGRLKADLKEFQTELTQLTSGSNSVPLDMLDGASQMY